MITPISLAIQGFKSFQKKQVFEFPQKFGFYFFTGRNEIEPDLGANGSGKTSFWDALVWCLYGKTPRNLKATNIVNWVNSIKCEVEFVFSNQDNLYSIKRTQSPNTLKLSINQETSRTIEQEDVDELLKLNFDSFLYSILFSQFGTMFFDLKPTPKSELFTSILDLSKWDDFSKKAKTRVSTLEGHHDDVQNYISQLKGSLVVLSQLKFDEKILNWQKESKETLANLEEEQKSIVKEIGQIKTEGEQFISSKEQLEEELRELYAVKKEAEQLVQEQEKVVQKIGNESGKVDAKIGFLKSDIKKILSVEDQNDCPYCKQPISKKHLDLHLSKLEQDLDKEQKSKEKIASQYFEESEVVGEINESIKEIQNEVRTVELELNSLNSKIAQLKKESISFIQQLEKIRLKINDTLNKENPYELEKEQNEKKIQGINIQIEQQSKDLVNIETELQAVKYWVKGFKEIRLYMISEVLGQLELEVNNCLYTLGLRDWKIEFAVDSETKSGTLRKGFTVLIYSPYNDEPVAWESWSGGESQRLRLAGSLGLSNLILARNGVDYSFEVFDEPSTWLSEKGIQDLLDTLSLRSKELNKQIWIIDHRSLEFGGFDETFVVVKDKKGSYFEVVEDA